MNQVTSILNAIEEGDLGATETLLPMVYDELRQMAGQKLARERPGHTFQATALVHEAYLRLADSNSRGWKSRTCQAVAVLVQALLSVFAIPLTCRIHAGVVFSNRDKRTLLDKMILLIDSLGIPEPFYFVADAYYGTTTAAGSVATPRSTEKVWQSDQGLLVAEEGGPPAGSGQPHLR